GVASVIAVVSLVQGMQYKISQDLQSIGSTFIEVYPDPGERRNPFLQKLPDLTIDDANAVQKGTTSIRQFTPLFIASAQMKYGDARHAPQQMYAGNGQYQEIVNHWVDQGRFFTPIDEESKKRVVVIGRDVIDGLRLGREPIGKVVQVNG